MDYTGRRHVPACCLLPAACTLTACCLLPAAALSLFKVFLTASPPVSLLSQTIPCSYCWQQFHLNKHTMHRIMGIGKTFHPGDPKNFDYPRSWSNETGYPPYYDFEYWLTSAATKKNPMLPATNTSYTGICPGDCDWAGKGGSCVPKGEVNATGGSLAGPIAVWCALDEPDEVCKTQPFFLAQISLHGKHPLINVQSQAQDK